RRHTTWPRDWSSAVCSSDLGTPHELGAFVAQHFSFGIVGVAGEQRGGRDRPLAGLAVSVPASALEWLPTHELAAPELVDARVTRSEERRVGRACRSWSRGSP